MSQGNMRRGGQVVALLTLVCVLVGIASSMSSCTRAGLEEIPPPPVYRDDKLEIRGDICTRDPETLVFPLYVLFVIDGSISMEVTDPPDPVTGVTGRERAVRSTWEQLLEDGPEGVRVGIMRFSSQAQSRTAIDLNGDNLADTYFTADTTRLATATEALRVTDRTTNFINAIGEAYFEIRTELINTEDQASLPLSKFVVVFLSDGLPDVDASGGARENTFDEIIDSIESIRELTEQFRVGSFEFHTAFIASGRDAFDKQAQDLLADMADAGGGTLRNFNNGEELNFLFVDFTVLRRVFTLKTLSAVNTNVTMDAEQLNDLPERFEELLTPDMGPDLGDMGADMSMGMMGDDMGDMGDMGDMPEPYDPLELFVDLSQDNYPTCGEPLVDSDGDGLSDAVEIQIGTNLLVPDTDDDGLSDYLEWQLSDDGLDPLDPTDSGCYIASPCVPNTAQPKPPELLMAQQLVEPGVSPFFCECVLDSDSDGICDCADPDARIVPPELEGVITIDEDSLICADNFSHDCVDLDADGFCDCPDVDNDGKCDYEDRDGDLLKDCEEVLFGSAQNGNDTDADGLPDPTEVRFQTNPGSPDLSNDNDADQTRNGIEVLSNTSPICNDSELRSRTAYRYELSQREFERSGAVDEESMTPMNPMMGDMGGMSVEMEASSGAQTCYDFKISNITLVPTVEAPFDKESYPGNGWNRVFVYAGEVSFDDPNSFANYRIACVMARYNPEGNLKEPPSGRIVLQESDFVEVEDFDPERDCKYPNARER